MLENLRHILSHPAPVSDGCKYESVSENGEIIKYKFFRKNRGDDFSMELQIQELKDLVAKLSEYLSNVAKEIVKETEANEQ